MQEHPTRPIRQAERRLICLVHSGEWTIDDQGHVWRNYIRGRYGVRFISRRRADRVFGPGYLGVTSKIRGTMIHGLAHRLVWQYWNGDIPDGLQINHLNGIKTDNRLSNLEVTTASGNCRHSRYVLYAQAEVGKRNPRDHLPLSVAAEIRAARRTGETLVAIAARFGVSYTTVRRQCRVRNGVDSRV